MDLSIIIVNWNAKKFLADCLRSVYENTKDIIFEIIVVDNASNDGSAEMVQKEFPHVILIENKENLGFNAANNRGIKISKGRHILILNPDTIVLGGALNQMMKFMDDNKDTGALGCKILNSDKTVHFYFRKVPTLKKEIIKLLFPKLVSLKEKRVDPQDYETIHQVEILSGCCMMIRKDVFNKIGLLDERFFMYEDDVDLCYQIKKNNWKIYYIPSAEVVHYGKQSTNQCKAAMTIESYRSTYKLFEKIYGNFSSYSFKCSAVLISSLKVMSYLLIYILSANKKEIIQKIKGHFGIIKTSFRLSK